MARIGFALITLLRVGVLSALVASACGEPERDVGVAVASAPLTVCGDSPTTTFGIDVSKWQGTIDWAAVAGDGVRFAFIRVSDGTGYIDQRFGPNWAGAGERGILRGAYQFFRADEDPEAQARIVLDHLAEHGPGELPPVIDVESDDGQLPATIAANVARWIDIVEAETGQDPIIYTGRYFWDGYVKSSAFADRSLWIAHWTSAACPGLPAPWDDWVFWQYSATGRVAGIAGDVDLDRFDGTIEELRRLGETTGCGDCGLGATCETVSGEPTCVDLACTTTFAGPDGRACAGSATLFVCDAGVASETPCPVDTMCTATAGGVACEATTPVEPNDDVEAGPEPTPEPTPEVVDQHGVVSATARPRSLSATTTLTDPGCGGRADAGWALVLLALLAAVSVLRPMR